MMAYYWRRATLVMMVAMSGSGQLHVKSATPVYRGAAFLEESDVREIVAAAFELESQVASVRRSNVGGYQSPSDVLERFSFGSLLRSKIEEAATRYLVDAEKAVFGEATSPLATARVTACWLNINRGTSSNAPHVHAEGQLSGVVFLGSSNRGDEASLVLLAPVDDTDAWIGQSDKWSGQAVRVPFEEATVVIFPVWLEHYVEPAPLAESTRISLSFNVDFDANGTPPSPPRYPHFDLSKIGWGKGLRLLWAHPLWFDAANPGLDDALYLFLEALDLNYTTHQKPRQTLGGENTKFRVCGLRCTRPCSVDIADPRPAYFDVAIRDRITGHTHPLLDSLVSVKHTLNLTPEAFFLAPCGIKARIAPLLATTEDSPSFVRYLELRV